MRSLPVAAALVLVWTGAAHADPDKDESGHRRGHKHGEYKEEFWDGNCKVERKWGKHGEYKEEVKCKGRDRPPPRVVYVQPREEWVEPSRGPVLVPQGGSGLLCNRDLIGAALGGAAGGLLGNQIGKGDGRVAATIGGALAGALVGGAIGRSMDQLDHGCVAHALGVEGDRVVTWENPRGETYEVKPRPTYRDRQGRACRDYVTTATIAGRVEQVYGTACRMPDGLWKLVG
jgi:surface antigen